MKKLSMIVAAATCLAVAAPTLITPAAAVVVVRKTVVKRPIIAAPLVRPRVGIGCRTVRKTSIGPGGKRRTVVSKVC